jgi:hypothetical protein
MESWLHTGMSVAQLGVAAVTIYFIWCKARKVKEALPKKKVRRK